MATPAEIQAANKRYRAALTKIRNIPRNKRSKHQKRKAAWYEKQITRNKKRLANYRASKPSPKPSPAVPAAAPAPTTPDYVGTGLTKAEFDWFKSYLRSKNITNTAAIKDYAAQYKRQYDSYVANKSTYDQYWHKIYGTLPSYGFINNPIAMAATLGASAGNVFGLDAATVKKQTEMFQRVKGQYEELGAEMQDINRLSAMFGQAPVNRGALARKLSGFDPGKGDWEARYNEYLRKRKGLYTGEGAAVGYSSKGGFRATTLDPEQDF